jgi:hypothetical protein
MFCVWGRSVTSGSYINAQCGTVGRTVTSMCPVLELILHNKELKNNVFCSHIFIIKVIYWDF